MNIRRVAWGTEKKVSGQVNDSLVDALVEKILERLGEERT